MADQQTVEASLVVGYLVGIDEKGDIVFKTIGSDPKITDLLGLQAVAEREMNRVYEVYSETGTLKVVQGINQLSRGLTIALQTVQKESREGMTTLAKGIEQLIHLLSPQPDQTEDDITKEPTGQDE